MPGITLPENLRWNILTIARNSNSQNYVSAFDEETLQVDFAVHLDQRARDFGERELDSDSANEKLIKDFATLKTLLAQNPGFKKLKLSLLLFAEIVAADQLSSFYFALIGSHITDLYLPIKVVENFPAVKLNQFCEFLRHAGITNVYLTGNGDFSRYAGFFAKYSKGNITILPLLQTYVPCNIHIDDEFKHDANAKDRLVTMIPSLAGNIVIIYNTSRVQSISEQFLTNLYLTFAQQRVDLILDQKFVTYALALEQPHWENLCQFLKKPNIVSLAINYKNNLQGDDEFKTQKNRRLQELQALVDAKQQTSQQPSFPSLKKLAVTSINCKFFTTVDKDSWEASQGGYVSPQVVDYFPSKDPFFSYWLTSKHAENEKVPLHAFGLAPAGGDLSKLSEEVFKLWHEFYKLCTQDLKACCVIGGNTLKFVQDNYLKLVTAIISELPNNTESKAKYKLLYELSKFPVLDIERVNPHTLGIFEALWKDYRMKNNYKTATRKIFDHLLKLNDPTGKFAKEIAAEQQLEAKYAPKRSC
jgi:hypothetical protein